MLRLAANHEEVGPLMEMGISEAFDEERRRHEATRKDENADDEQAEKPSSAGSLLQEAYENAADHIELATYVHLDEQLREDGTLPLQLSLPESVLEPAQPSQDESGGSHP